MNRETVHIAALDTAMPPFVIRQEDALARLLARYQGRLRPASLEILRRVFSHPGVRRRRFAIESPDAFLRESPDARMERFTRWAVRLASQAARGALERIGAAPEEVTGLVVNTCTGYLCPGLSSYLIEALRLRRDLKAYDLVGSGCGGAVPNLQIAESLLARADGLVLSVSVEICSAAMQMGDDASLLISNALFADGAAAAVLRRRPQGLAVVDSASRCLPEYRDEIRFVYRHGRLQNQLSPKLAQRVGSLVPEVIGDLLKSHGLRPQDIRYWALHAGGAKVLDALQAALAVPDGCLEDTRAVLAEYGNCSSVSVWLALKRILNAGVAPGEWCLFASFGAGFSAHACLLRHCEAAQ